MKRMLLLVGLLAVALATVGAQSAAAAPTLTGFAPGSGPPTWSVTLTGTGFTGATAVTFTPTDPSYSPETAMFTVTDDTTIVATVPFLATKPLAATLTVKTPDGSTRVRVISPSTGGSGCPSTGARRRAHHADRLGFHGSHGGGLRHLAHGLSGKRVLFDGRPRQGALPGLGDTKIVATVPSLRVGGATGSWW